jgi:hypothetical protein
MDSGYWKGVRENGLDLDSWRDYVRFSPHLHSIVFGDPSEHEGDDFFISVKKEGGEFVEMDTKRVVGYLFYILTHVGVASDFHSKATRSFGCLFDLDPKEILEEDKYVKLAHKVAEMIDMRYDEDSDSIERKVESGNDSSHVDEYDWINVWELEDYLTSDDWLIELSDDELDFFEVLNSYLRVNGVPPPADSYMNIKLDQAWLSRMLVTREVWLGSEPDSVAVFVESIPKTVESMSKPQNIQTDSEVDDLIGSSEDLEDLDEINDLVGDLENELVKC